jgi:hypothetical protein
MSWSKAFARQSQSDFEARDHLLQNARLPQCHQLHYLQMAMEKLAKAHLVAEGSDSTTIQGSHAYIAKVIPLIVRQMLSRTSGKGQAWVVDAIRQLTRKIELLAPAVDDGGAVPSNCEYPWQTANGEIVTPADHDFKLDLIFEKAGITMIKAVRARANELAGSS